MNSIYMYLYLYLQCVLFSGVCTFVSWHFVIAINVRRPSSQRKPVSQWARPQYARGNSAPLLPLLVLTHATHCIILDWHYFWGHSGELPVLNTTKLVSFLSAFSYFLLRCVANFRRGAGCARGSNETPLSCASRCPWRVLQSTPLLVTVTYTHGCPCACLCRSVGLPLYVCVCVSENLSESRICYFIGIQFELSLFFPVHMRFLPVKMNFFLLFAIVHCCNSCCCFWCSLLFLFLLQTQPPTVWDLKASLLLYLSTYVCQWVCALPQS